MITLPRLVLTGSLLAFSAAASAALYIAPPKPPGLPAPPVLRLPAPGNPHVIGDHRRVYGAPIAGRPSYGNRHYYRHHDYRHHYRY